MEFREVKPGHFVMCTEAEFKAFHDSSILQDKCLEGFFAPT